MNEDHKRRGFAYSKTLMTAAICALFLGGGSVMAHAADAPAVQEQQQTSNITVTIVDSKGEPIIGANVVEKGTTNGTITDFDGKATLNIKPGATVQVSFVGYKTQEVKVNKDMRIALKEDNELLDEVVVVGYGSQKKVNLTGAVASVDVDKTIDSRPITDIGRALQGAVPGLTVTTNSGKSVALQLSRSVVTLVRLVVVVVIHLSWWTTWKLLTSPWLILMTSNLSLY
jgi:hypothetical protein